MEQPLHGQGPGNIRARPGSEPGITPVRTARQATGEGAAQSVELVEAVWEPDDAAETEEEELLPWWEAERLGFFEPLPRLLTRAAETP